MQEIQGCGVINRPAGSSLPSTLLVTVFLLAAFAFPASAQLCATEEQRLAEQDIRAVGMAILAWVTDQNGDPLPRGVPQLNMGDFVPISQGRLVELLVPDYLDAVPVLDPWGTAYDYRLDETLASPFATAIRSAGGDGVFDGTLYSAGEIVGEAEDILWANGLFFRSLPTAQGQAQPATVEALRDVGSAMLSWLTDVVGVQKQPRGGQIDLSLFTPIAYADLAELLTPQYLFLLPERDGWGNLLEFWVDEADPLGPQVLAIRSAGADGQVSGDVYTVGPFPAAQQDEDVVWADGFFVHFPEGELPPLLLTDGFESGGTVCWSVREP